MHLADHGHDSRCWRLAAVFVIRDEQPDLLRECVLVEQQFDTFAGAQLALLVQLFDLFRAAAEFELSFERGIRRSVA